MLTKLTLTIYWSTVGYYESPQPYVANARLSFDSNRTLSTESTVEFKLNVKYVKIGSVLSDLTAGERPSIIPQLPRVNLCDLFILMF